MPRDRRRRSESLDGTLPSEMMIENCDRPKCSQTLIETKENRQAWSEGTQAPTRFHCYMADRRQPRRPRPKLGLHPFRLDKRKFPFVTSPPPREYLCRIVGLF